MLALAALINGRESGSWSFLLCRQVTVPLKSHVDLFKGEFFSLFSDDRKSVIAIVL